MMRIVIPVITLLFCVFASPAHGACTKSSDCFGNNVCVGGQCVQGEGNPKEEAPSAEPPSEAPPSEPPASPPSDAAGEPPSAAGDTGERRTAPPEPAPEAAPVPAVTPVPAPVAETTPVPSPLPVPAPAPVTATPPPPSESGEKADAAVDARPREGVPSAPLKTHKPGFQSGYFDLSFALGIFAFGHEVSWHPRDLSFSNPELDEPYSQRTQEGILPGFRLGIYTVRKHLQTGLFFMFNRGYGISYDNVYFDDDVTHSHFTTGLTGKMGGIPGKRVYFGASVDLGLDIQVNSWSSGLSEVFYGLQVMPKFCVEVYAVDSRVKLAFPLAFGVNAVLFAMPTSSDTGVIVVTWDLSPMILIGVAFGG